MLLSRVEMTGLDISAESEVLNYVHTAIAPRIVLARVDLGDDDAPIAGTGGDYVLRTYLNGNRLSPDSAVVVAVGVTQTLMQSRQLILNQDDVLSVTVVGAAGDTGINTVTQLMDATPVTVSDISGIGSIPVDHNYDSLRALAYDAPDGRGIADARILAYLKSDYTAGRRAPQYVVGEAYTNVRGEWVTPMMLDPGTYTLVFYKSGQYGPNTKHVTVTS